MKFNSIYKVYGDTNYRGHCPLESLEQVTFFNHIRMEFPDTYGALAIHPRNEGLKKGAQLRAVQRHKAEGQTKGAPDIIIPVHNGFVCELKRRDHTKSSWQDGQENYLCTAELLGAFSCVALGADAAIEAFHDWIAMHQ